MRTGNKFNTTQCNKTTMKTIMKGLWKSSGWLVMAAALSFGIASCSSDNDAVAEQQSVKPTGKYTMTVQVTKGDADTRALKLGTDGTSVDAYWTEGEEVLVYQEKKVGDNFEDVLLGTLTAAANDDVTTTLTGTLDAPVADKPLYFYLHSKDVDYSTQNGTLASIAENQDYAWGRVYPYDATDNQNGFTISGNEVIVPNGALTLESKQAIVKFTLLDAYGADLNVRSLTVTDEALNLTSQTNSTPSFISGAPLTITPPDDASPTNELYVAISGLNKEDKHSHLVLTATGEDGNEYIYTKEYSAGASVYFTHGMYYTRTVKMKKGFTTFSENSVIKVGDLIRLTQEWDVNNHSWYLPAGKTGTLVRADIDDSGKVTEAADGAYYVIKVIYHDPNDVNHDNDYNFYFFDDKSMPVGKTSDGLVVKNVDVSGTMPTCIIGVNGYCEVWNWKSEEYLNLNPDPVSNFNFYYFPNEGVTLHGINANMQFIDGLVNLGPSGSDVSDPDVLSETSFTFSAPDNKKFVEIKMIFKVDENNYAGHALFASSSNGWVRSGNTWTYKPSNPVTEVTIEPFEDLNDHLKYLLDISGIESIVFTLADI